MGLSDDLISQFIKATNDKKEIKNEKTVYGTMVKYNGINYVKIDGSDLLTPVSSTTFTEDGERVTVTIKNHTAMVTGNISSPSARNSDVSSINKQISEFGATMSYKINTEDLNTINDIFDRLKTKVATISGIESINADIEKLQSEFSKLDYVDGNIVETLKTDIENLKAKFGEFASISAEDLEVINEYMKELYDYTADFTYVSADILGNIKSDIKNANINHANIDFTNITRASVENFILKSGLIENLVFGDTSITGDLVGITIDGDLIKANTVKSNRLILNGENGLYYKLNLDGVTAEAEQTEYNSVNGNILTVNSVTPSKINIDDLAAFGATIGGFKINDTSIYSSLKDSVNNMVRGIYLDSDGQISFGDENHFIKFFKDLDDSYNLMISGAFAPNLIGGYYQSIADDGANSNGYLNFADIKVDAINQNGLIEMEIIRKGDNYPTKFYIRFANVDNTDPDLEIFDVSNSDTKLYIAKTDTSTWSIYVPKAEGYDNVIISSIHYNALQMGSDIIKYKNIFVESLPNNYIVSRYSNAFSECQQANTYKFLSSESMIKGRSDDGGFDFYFKENGIRIVFKDGEIWRVDASGTWTKIAG